MENLNKQIGQRVRALRLQRSMTQSELAGEHFSRNMLSMIENGVAAPSLETLTVLAERLEVPVGYFFAADDEEIARFMKMSMIETIRQLYSQGQYEDCLGICASLSGMDDEILWIIVQCNMGLAGQAFDSYALSAASGFLRDAEDASENCVYRTAPIRSTVRYAELLIRSIGMAEIPQELASPALYPDSYIPTGMFAFVEALRSVNRGLTEDAESLLRSELISSPPHRSLLEGKLLLAHGQTEQALGRLRQLLNAPATGFFTRFHLLCTLENCAKDASDFKLAYQYASEKVRLLEQFTK